MKKGGSARFRARAEDGPSPFVVEPSQHWDGNDGNWSSFHIHVGEPEQRFRVFPATNAQETWIPVPEGCVSSDPLDCGARRGVELFQSKKSTGFQTNQSSTWTSMGLYDLAIDNKLDFSGNALYGLDTVGLGLSNPGSLSLNGQVVGGIATKDFYLGIFGLGPKPPNFTDTPIPSYMRNLKDRNLIPSLSYGYTAGAYYRKHTPYFERIIWLTLFCVRFQRGLWKPGSWWVRLVPFHTKQHQFLLRQRRLAKSDSRASIDHYFEHSERRHRPARLRNICAD